MTSESDLDRFRKEWLREVNDRSKTSLPTKGTTSSAAGASGSTSTAHPESSGTSTSAAPSSSKPRLIRTSDNEGEPEHGHGPSHGHAHVPERQTFVIMREKNFEPASVGGRMALAAYREAVEAETDGNLDRALELYRRAFKLDSNVDRVYERSIARPGHRATGSRSGHSPSNSLSHPHVPHEEPLRPKDSDTDNTLATAVDLLSLTAASGPGRPSSRSAPGITTLDAIVLGFINEPLGFEPADEKAKVPLRMLPPEMIVHVLHVLAERCDYPSIENFALVNRYTRLLTMENSIWREMTNLLFNTPQIPEDMDFPKTVESIYSKNHRRALIEHPRIRFDGVYIAVCHYVRPGLSENAWVSVSHLITYHRYLRFFPNGMVLSLLANDDTPSEMVRFLKPSFRRKGFFVGTWELDNSTIFVRDLLDPALTDSKTDSGGTKYAFEMTLSLRSKPRGRWNRLELREYSTVRLDTAESEALPLTHERPFWFSKVKSYGALPQWEE